MRILAGNETATEYDSQARNFSTETNIETLPSGKKLFIIHNFTTSWVHRTLDNLMKRMTGTKLHKANRSEWKKQYEKKSTIPMIPNKNSDTVILPFIPNINMRDLLSHHKQIKDFGECKFAETLTDEQKLEIIDKAVEKIKKLHKKDITWGELDTHNMIVDKDMNIHICDPETEYYSNVPIEEQKARDLYHFIITAAADINESSDIDYAIVAKRIINNYDNPKIIKELKKVAEKKPSLLNSITHPHLVMATLHLKSYKEYMKVKKDIVNHIEKIEEKNI